MTVSYLEKAIVDEEIRPNQPGRVSFQNSWWPAKCDDLQITLKPGAVVRVLRLENITLIVEA
ncbi:MAG: NfeD family protein [Microcoleus sp. PH2017_29_MFU_D_A]|uniref:NfeD family protein n=1 Tax=unclassified Microcoleus TaxID=2642155 RepID=UPI001DCA708F|nr:MULTISPECIES: NfeD family protein [unclassified Microcoleus]MCC3416390.1 NfeD family protein [Microcoleus sp. PH2017_07_MST_O_A]MCC3432980.1 NfeD family protein [Microcoleus sp. PH2017_04_SCI_O_A]MCC3441354.1 NfeD family protein [Microcoleus sp. PH2017_03_ELD_O_A]MCC3467959.1 NfeD family protein [Microcoleus sp. PH2017_06_SFM_O_A]MCC3503536.1 NfeD family protein [Microcoleus sp. PH2017_19_SFW_U_A]MCC3511515.1 NfeD family protein [Microcoleus sp. PH2017_17_BER_D_A]TAE09055.1 MAG: hypotheti